MKTKGSGMSPPRKPISHNISLAKDIINSDLPLSAAHLLDPSHHISDRMRRKTPLTNQMRNLEWITLSDWVFHCYISNFLRWLHRNIFWVVSCVGDKVVLPTDLKLKVDIFFRLAHSFVHDMVMLDRNESGFCFFWILMWIELIYLTSHYYLFVCMIEFLSKVHFFFQAAWMRGALRHIWVCW